MQRTAKEFIKISLKNKVTKAQVLEEMDSFHMPTKIPLSKLPHTKDMAKKKSLKEMQQRRMGQLSLGTRVRKMPQWSPGVKTPGTRTEGLKKC